MFGTIVIAFFLPDVGSMRFTDEDAEDNLHADALDLDSMTEPQQIHGGNFQSTQRQLFTHSVPFDLLNGKGILLNRTGSLLAALGLGSGGVSFSLGPKAENVCPTDPIL